MFTKGQAAKRDAMLRPESSGWNLAGDLLKIQEFTFLSADKKGVSSTRLQVFGSYPVSEYFFIFPGTYLSRYSISIFSFVRII